jgi:hypothetical protein
MNPHERILGLSPALGFEVVSADADGALRRESLVAWAAVERWLCPVPDCPGERCMLGRHTDVYREVVPFAWTRDYSYAQEIGPDQVVVPIGRDDLDVLLLLEEKAARFQQEIAEEPTTEELLFMDAPVEQRLQPRGYAGPDDQAAEEQKLATVRKLPWTEVPNG